MIASFWEAFGSFVAIASALLVGSWAFFRVTEDTRKKHQENAMELRSIIAASELVPKFVELIGNVQGQAGATSGSITRTRIEEIIGAATFSSAVNSISRTFARMTEIDSLYLRIVEKCLACSRDLQFAAITPILAIALGFLFENNLDLSTASLLTLTLSYGVAIGFKVIYDLSQYTSAIKRLITKDNEIRLGRTV